ncbi:MAG: hypothetical protein AAGI44_12325 [Pseudomonadota bacterium]
MMNRIIEGPRCVVASLLLGHLVLGSAVASDPLGETALFESRTGQEYLTESFDCVLMRVSTQFATGEKAASQNVEPELHCEETLSDSENRDGVVFELRNIPDALTRFSTQNLKSNTTVLTIKNVYRDQHQLIFTDETLWSLSER